MNTYKLFSEVMQGMQDLTRLFEKAIAVESKLYVDFKALIAEGVPAELDSTELGGALDLQAEKLHNTFKILEEAMNE